MELTMARIRTIKPEFPQSESMGNVSREARLCFILLWTQADDAGRLRGNSRMLASLLYPYDDDAKHHIEGWLVELERQDCITRYVSGGTTLIQVNAWLEHQKIDKPSPSKLPPPPPTEKRNPEPISVTPREDSRIHDSHREDSVADQGEDHIGDPEGDPDGGASVREDSAPTTIDTWPDARAPKDSLEWAQFFDVEFGFEVNLYPGSPERRDFRQLAKRWCDVGATCGQMRRAAEKAQESAKESITYPPGYYDSVLRKMSVAPKSEGASRYRPTRPQTPAELAAANAEAHEVAVRMGILPTAPNYDFDLEAPNA
jgi:hypothetical protein